MNVTKALQKIIVDIFKHKIKLLHQMKSFQLKEPPTPET